MDFGGIPTFFMHIFYQLIALCGWDNDGSVQINKEKWEVDFQTKVQNTPTYPQNGVSRGGMPLGGCGNCPDYPTSA